MENRKKEQSENDQQRKPKVILEVQAPLKQTKKSNSTYYRRTYLPRYISCIAAAHASATVSTVRSLKIPHAISIKSSLANLLAHCLSIFFNNSKFILSGGIMSHRN